MSAPRLISLPFTHWQAAPALDAQALVYCTLYLLAAHRVGRWPLQRTLCFLGGVAAMLVALQSGLERYDDRLLSVHMVQHMILLLIAPLLLLCARPVLLTLRALPAHRRARLARALARLRVLTGPLQCLAVFYAVVLLSHLPGFYDATLSHPALHYLEHGLFLLAGLMLWWPVLDADPVQAQHMSGLGRLIYVIAAMPPMALVGAYLNRHAPLVYASYQAPARSLGVSALVDQENAGAIMWVLGNVIMVAVGLWSALRTLVAQERRQQLREARAR